MKIQGVALLADVVSANDRIYSKEALENIKRELLKKHPVGEFMPKYDASSGSFTSLERVSHRVIDASIYENKLIVEAEVLGTKWGEELKDVLLDGRPVVFATRGFGEVKDTSSGRYVENYKVISVDLIDFDDWSYKDLSDGELTIEDV